MCICFVSFAVLVLKVLALLVLTTRLQTVNPGSHVKQPLTESEMDACMNTLLFNGKLNVLLCIMCI